MTAARTKTWRLTQSGWSVLDKIDAVEMLGNYIVEHRTKELPVVSSGG
jgi:hypothetical protein